MSRHTTSYGKDSVVEKIEFGLRSPGKLFTRGVTILLAMMVCGYLLTVFASVFVLKYFALIPQDVLNGKIWMLLTFPFISGGCGLIFNGLTLLFIGSAFEHKRGTGGLFLLWLLSSIICAVIWVAISFLTGKNFVGAGAGVCSFAFIGMLGLLFKNEEIFFFIFPMKAQHLSLLLIAIGILLSISPPISLVWVLGAVIAYAYDKLRWKISIAGSGSAAPAKYKGKGDFVDID